MESLTKELKKTIALLSTGTFLEYFDLMLYVHMAVLLNGLFYEATDPHAVAVLGAFTFCSTFVFRPFGALIFGWIGDNFGRKPVMILTTSIMAISCLVMANLPTYAQIGFGASIIMTLCRIMQSMSSTGEVTSCELYLMELTKPPIQYPILGAVPFFAALGGTFALGIASLVTTTGLNWRIAFYIGTTIAVIGVIGRTTLKETPEFANTQRQIDEASRKFNLTDEQVKKVFNIKNEKVSIKTVLALGIIQCIFPLYYYFTYIYCGNLFKILFNYTAEDVIHHNFYLSIVDLSRIVFLSWVSYYINPLKILKIQLVISAIFIICCPFLLDNATASYQLTVIQYGMMLLAIHGLPAIPIFYKHIPILKRFTCAGLTYSIGRGVMFAITSFGLVYLMGWFGSSGLLMLFVPCLIAYTFALFYFDNLEKTKIISLPLEIAKTEQGIAQPQKIVVQKGSIKKGKAKKKTRYVPKKILEAVKV